MRLVLSPYDLSTRSPAAFMAILLASDDLGATTLLPRPFTESSPKAVREAAEVSPRYHRLIEHWRWSGPLWTAGVLRAGDEQGTPLDEARALCARIDADAELAPLRRMVSADVLRDEAAYLDAVSRDLLRGGGDPAVSVPVEAGIALHAARRSAVLVRTPSAAAAKRPSAAADRQRLRWSLCVPTRGEGAELLLLRDAMSPLLVALRGAIRASIAAMLEGIDDRELDQDLERCSKSFNEAFAGSVSRGGTLARRGIDATMLEPAVVTATVARETADAELLAAARALRTLQGVPPQPSESPTALLGPARVVIMTVKLSPFDPGRVGVAAEPDPRAQATRRGGQRG